MVSLVWQTDSYQTDFMHHESNIPKKLIALLQLQRNNIKINIQMLNRIRTNQKEKYKKKKKTNQLAVRFGRFGSKQLRIN